MSNQDDELRGKIIDTILRWSSQTTGERRDTLAPDALTLVDEIEQLITARDAELEAAIRKTERRKGIRDGYSYALTGIDIANDYVDAWKRVSAAHKKAVERCHD